LLALAGRGRGSELSGCPGADSEAEAAGGEVVVTPERGPSTLTKLQAIAARMEKLLFHGCTHGILLVADRVKLDEPAGSPAVTLAGYLQEYFRRPGSPFPDLEARTSVLGHLQRGGPTAADRIMAARYA
jgi:6-phosphofructokinase